LRALAASFISFHERYSHFFKTKTSSVASKAFQYLSGLVQTVRKNIERMVEVVPDTDYQSLQHFVTNSPWDARPVMNQVAMDADSLFEGSLDTGLIIDETSFPKSGKKSVAVNPVLRYFGQG
jgi:SRSO17 transposase